MTLNQEQVTAVLQEWERRWRSRTPPPDERGVRQYKDIGDILPGSKVPWSETLSIVEKVTGTNRDLDHRLQLQGLLVKKLRQLRREFPDLKW